MKLKKVHIALNLCLLSLLIACSEVIDLDTEREGGELVVFGRITNGTMGNQIRITKATLPGLTPSAVINATVSVRDDQGNEVAYIGNGKGDYVLMDNAFEGVPGRSYSLRIALPDGEVYESIPEVMPRVSARDSLHFEIRDIEETSNQGVTSTRSVVSVYSDTEITEQRSDLFIKWDVEEVYSFQQAALPTHNFPFYVRHTCYISNELEQQRVLLYDGSALRASEINNQSIVDRTIDESFRGLHYFNLIHQSLTTGAHAFWEALDKNTNRVGSIFDQPPGVVPTNIYNVNNPNETVFGYFEVVATDTAHLRITNREIDRFFPDPCPHVPEVEFAPTNNFRFLERYYSPECLDCTIIPNSSLTRPSYFD